MKFYFMSCHVKKVALPFLELVYDQRTVIPHKKEIQQGICGSQLPLFIIVLIIVSNSKNCGIRGSMQWVSSLTGNGNMVEVTNSIALKNIYG